MAVFQRATKTQSRLRLALAGPAGSGKTYTALQIGSEIAQATGSKLAVIDTERGSASKYSELWDFDVLELESFHPNRYIDAISDAEAEGYGVLIIDSLSHAWMGKDGALALVDLAAKRSQSSNSFAAWRDVTPLHNALVDAMLSTKLHIIVTLRSKQDYVQEKDERTGKTIVRKIGLAPVQRDGLEYEFDVYGDLDSENNLIIGKTRCPALAGTVYPKPGKDLAAVLHAWVSGGEAPVVKPKPATAASNGAKVFTREEIMARWQQLVNDANDIKLPKEGRPAIAEEDTDDERLAKGKKLKTLIDKHAESLVAGKA